MFTFASRLVMNAEHLRRTFEFAKKNFVSVFFYGASQPDIARSCGLHHLQAFLVIKLYSMIKIHKMLSYIGLENSEK